MNQSFSVDLTNCDREPIHIPGSIQPHGALLAFDGALTTLLRHSDNAADMLGTPPLENGLAAEAILGGDLLHALRNAITSSTDGTRPTLLIGKRVPSGRDCDIAIHRNGTDVIVEFEPASVTGDRPLHIAREMIGRIGRLQTVAALADETVRLIRATLGYDRVMIYRFEEDGAGKVISESKQAHLESFLGQYFPASDIPQQARALYLKNTIRLISDASFTPVRLVPQFDDAGRPLDLSFAHLRSVSPIHCEYLRNMGVAASMSISIIVGGELWGLIAAHHYEPRTLPMTLRVAAEIFGEFFSLHLGALLRERKFDSARAVREALDRLARLSADRDLGEVLVENIPEFGKLVPSDGVGLYIDGKWHGAGSTPPAGAIPELAAFVGEVSEGRIWATHTLTREFTPADEYYEAASGVLAIPLSQLPRDYLFYFRKELVQTLDWAGNPEKSYEFGEFGDRLTPRKSFAIWKETVHKKAQVWTDEDLELGEATRSSLVEVLLRYSELMAGEREKAEVRRRRLNEELSHRVKNILAVIRSLVGQPTSEEVTLEAYVTALTGRIQALAYAHDQVVRGSGGGPLAELIAAELGPYRVAEADIRLDGPPLGIDQRAFSVMALVLHELATNAAKYGALSVDEGRLDITWALDPDGDLLLDWRESGGPAVSPPRRRGFGTALLERSVSFDLDGESRIEYAPEGLKAHFRLPATNIRMLTGDEPPAQEPARPAPPVDVSAFKPPASALVVEDEMLIALDAESMLEEMGVRSVASANSVESALTAIAERVPEVALLDVNLGSRTSAPVAEELARLGVPFIFATGYGDAAAVPQGFDAPVVHKPYDAAALRAAIATAIGKTSAA